MARGARKKRSRRSNPEVRPGPDADVIEMLGIEALVRPVDAPAESAPQRALLSRQVSKRSAIVAGDRVSCGVMVESGADEAESGPGLLILSVHKRRNVLERANFHGHPQAIASNLDHVVIVVTPRDPPLRPGLIDRYLIASDQAGLAPIICLNKADLIAEDEAPRHVLAPYEGLGIPVVATSNQNPGIGVAALAALLRHRRSVLVGHSGVGKSSLACELIPGLNRRVGEVNETIGRGRHTTTTAALLALPQGGELVDTPGIRAFGLVRVEPQALASHYPEFVSREEACRFRGCSHIHEPGCAVRAAVLAGEIDPGRYERYIQIHASLQQDAH